MNLRRFTVILIFLSLLTGCLNFTSTPSYESTVIFTLTTTSVPPSSTPSPSKPFSTTPTKATKTPTIRALTPSSTNTQLPVEASFLTSTPQPPLVSHTWELEQVLVEVGESGGDPCCWYTSPPVLVLYANGLLIRTKYAGLYKYEMMARILDRHEICALLNTLDQVGFLDYDPTIYRDPMDGLPITFIKVSAWKKQYVYGQVLNTWIYEGSDWWTKECTDDTCKPPPLILPALSNSYKLLDQYDPGGLEKLPPRQMIIWSIPDEGDTVATPWPIKEISLKEIVQKANEENSFSLLVDDLVIVNALEKIVSKGIYEEGDVRRIVYVRPLWPLEYLTYTYFPNFPTAEAIIPSGTTMTCNPEDDILPVP